MNDVSKEFCVLDPKSGDLICMNCALKRDVDEIKLRELFNQLYAVRIDSSYCFGKKREFGKGKNIVSLRDELIKMINAPKNLSFEGIYRLFENNEQRQSLKLASIINQFMDLFSFSVSERYTNDYMVAVEKILHSNSSEFFKENPSFECKYKNAYYNTQMMVLSKFPLSYVISGVEDKKYFK